MKNLWEVLARQRDYRLVLSAGLISLTGDWILRIGLAYHVYALTGSTLASGGLLLASFLPLVVLGSLAGVFVDRWDRRRTMIFTNLAHAFVLLPLLVVRDDSTIWVIYLVVLAQSCLQQFFRPAEQSLVPLLVEPRQLVTANALNSQTSDVARLVGAALGGVLAAIGGLPLLALVDAATYLIAMALLIGVRHRPEPLQLERAGGLRPAVLKVKAEWIEGLRICVGGPAMRLVFVFGLVTGVGEGAMSTLFAPFVSAELGGDGTAYGLITSSQAIGGIVGGLVAAAVGSRFSAAKMWGYGAVVFGLIDLAMFCYPLFWNSLAPAFVCMVLVGLPGAFLIAGSMTVIQRLTDDASRGRVFGALFAAEGVALLVGIAVAGVLGDVVGIIPVLVVQGLGFVAGGIVVLGRLRILEPAPVEALTP
ncbi:putative MFS family arabinose efflux permease [Kribbella orskensis]|uniref:MFS family arabinose efflux permease n=1 Tax=Kribbella orskensis TaxID=2512216 RepID=A0ABY2BV85_9ACTN|nr:MULTISPECIES: MFS transporter [Kribbella]TCN44016.1 putative MFS family arabinose efflux permease [Kribbella sp. VKM Ac-2500]TCO32206.1 putative MFS family arabinose efflux permease [Kribbella orskensis]